MARKVISRDDVYRAADQVFESGGEPSILAVHKIIGRGSYTTIRGYLTEWENEHKDEHSRAPLVELPDMLTDESNQFLRKLWVLASEYASETLRGEREAMQQREIDLEKKIRDAIDLADSATDEVDELREQVQQARQEKETALSEAAVRLDKARTEQALANAEIARLTAELDKATDDNTDLKQSLYKARHEAEHALGTLTEAQQALAEAQDKAAGQGKALADLQATATARAETIRNLEENLAQARNALAEARASAEQSALEKGQFAGELKEKERQQKRLEIQLEEQATKYTAMASELLALQRREQARQKAKDDSAKKNKGKGPDKSQPDEK